MLRPQVKMSAHTKDWRDAVYGDLVGECSEEIGLRLRGARIACGYVSLPTAAHLLDVRPMSLLHAERGYRPIDEELVHGAAGVYGVSEAFLLEGTEANDREVLAERLARAMESSGLEPLEELGDQDDGEIEGFGMDPRYEVLRERLIAMRTAAGNATPAEAAIAHGWDRPASGATKSASSGSRWTG